MIPSFGDLDIRLGTFVFGHQLAHLAVLVRLLLLPAVDDEAADEKHHRVEHGDDDGAVYLLIGHFEWEILSVGCHRDAHEYLPRPSATKKMRA